MKKSEISLTAKIILKAKRFRSKYITRTQQLIEENVQLILSHPNVKPSCVPLYVFTTIKVINKY